MAKKKKTQPQTANNIDSTTPSSSLSRDSDLKSLIHDHSLFFDRLVESIPARFYLPTDDKEKPWFQGLSKAAKASARKESRENIKKARRQRLDPEKSATTLDLLKKSIDAEKEKSRKSGTSDAVESDRAVTYEELRLRLRKKIEELKSGRNTSDEVKDERSIGKRKREDEKVVGNRENQRDYVRDDLKKKEKKKKKKEKGVDKNKVGNEKQKQKKTRKINSS